MMKKVLLIISLLCNVAAFAQVSSGRTKFTDNWSVGLDGGVISNLHDWDVPNGAIAGVQLIKNITPSYSLEFSGELGVNNNNNWNIQRSSNAIDNVLVLASSKLNLMRMFCQCESPRFFEMEARAGIGYMRNFYPSSLCKDRNSGVAKLGVDFNFNLGKMSEWTVALRPAVLLRTNNGMSGCDYSSACSRYTHNAVAQVTAGVIYHFKNGDGKHYFTRPVISSEKFVGQREILAKVSQEKADLNLEIKRLNSELESREKQVNRLQAQMRAMIEQQEASAVANEKKVKENLIDNGKNEGEFRVYFPFSESAIAGEQVETVKRVVAYLKQNKKTTITVNGYASEEGDERFNEYLAKQRALSVKKMLVDNFGIDARRIKAVGKGVSTSFGAPEWNRVSICVVKK